jgi:opacity protein-like surface antigen
MNVKKILAVIVTVVIANNYIQAGNPDRAGEAGAYELLVNPWGRSNGFNSMNTARAEGLESMNLNVAGLSFAKRTEIGFSRIQLLQGSGVSFNSLGLAQGFGKHKENVVGVSFTSVNLGEIERTLVNNPEGGVGSFKPTFLNIAVGYSRAFSDAIRGGVAFRMINQRIDDLNASGFAIDAGIQYVTGKRENIRFGIALRNVGTPMKYTGNGLTFRGNAPQGDFLMSQEMRTERFQLPTQLNIGGSYDFLIGPDKELGKHLHRATIVANFTSNAFGKDHIGGGVEYGFQEMFLVRAGYRYESGITKVEERTNAHTGLAAGATVNIPLSKKKKDGAMLGIDYAYRTSNPFSGTHCIGARINL